MSKAIIPSRLRGSILRRRPYSLWQLELTGVDDRHASNLLLVGGAERGIGMVEVWEPFLASSTCPKFANNARFLFHAHPIPFPDSGTCMYVHDNLTVVLWLLGVASQAPRN
jgi:hypothetical protein